MGTLARPKQFLNPVKFAVTMPPNSKETCVISRQCSKMHSVQSPFPQIPLKVPEMAIPIKLPEILYPDSTAPDHTCNFEGVDEVDNPILRRRLSEEENEKNNKVFKCMKHEVNRLNSFSGKWPLVYIKPTDLAATGLFYLQSDDKVQCAFCHITIKNWTVGQKPLREHMRNSPKCPFILGSDVGNVSVMQQSPKHLLQSKPIVPAASYTPRHPRMADIKNRLMTYRDWPRIMLSPKQLAECGLYYTGVADVVTCFFCGGSLGNWELDDSPWVEHQKFFPNCTYLRLLKSSGKLPTAQMSPTGGSSNPNNSVHREVIRQACDIFPKSLVEKAVLKRMSEGAQRFTSLNELCEDILELREQEKKPWSQPRRMELEKSPDTVKTEAVTAQVSNVITPKTVKDVLLCKICMDQEMGVVFQPCGHLVACPKCAEQLFDCPLCRRPVTNKVRTYLS